MPVGEAGLHAAVEVRIVRRDPSARHHLAPERWQSLRLSFPERYSVRERVRESRWAKAF